MNTTAMKKMNSAERVLFDEYCRLFEAKRAAWQKYGDLMEAAYEKGGEHADVADAAFEDAQRAEDAWLSFCRQHHEATKNFYEIAYGAAPSVAPRDAPRATMRWQNNGTAQVCTIDHMEDPEFIGAEVVVVLTNGDRWQWSQFYKHFHLLGEM